MNVLQMAFANERRLVSVGTHQVDEGVGSQGEGNSRTTNTVNGLHPTGHHGGAVGLALRTRYIEFVEADAIARNPVDMRCPEDGMPITA